ncbi:ABC transporter ATP-binding protein [Streptococcus plurextorum]|uniref:ABC transporter ATP-binding protein n=1 Tax=Streptococcus plurextorum TaxID=456876 RepID=UPI000418C7A8|nr:ABC transporter ATP-binding protein [Streptococcus plurextorum]
MLKRLLKDLLASPSLIISIFILTIAQVALTIYLPILIGRAIDSLLQEQLLLVLPTVIGQMVVVIVANSLVQWLAPLLYNRLIFKKIEQLRQSVIAKLHHLPITYLDKHGVGDMVSRLTADTEQLSNGLLMIFNQFLVGFLTILVTIVTMAGLDIVMLVLVLCLTPLSLFVARFIASKSYSLYQSQTQSRGLQTQLVEEMIGPESLIQSFNGQAQAIASFTTINETYAKHSLGATFYSSTVNPATRFVNALIYALLTGVGAYRIMTGNFTVGQLTTFLNYVAQYTKPFNDISSVLAELQSALACAERLYAILDEPSLIDDGRALPEGEKLAGEVIFDQVSFAYPNSPQLIDKLSMTIPAASKVAIVGPTGAGKSTLINLLMRFYDVTGGQILLDGTALSDYKREDFRSQIGMVLQETWLKNASIHDNIAYANPNASREEVVAAAKSANADFFIRQLPQGYDTLLKDGGDSLSQGQRQLLTIARIFLKLPQILILDEATSSIDTRTELLVQEAFETLMQGRTSFIIAHRLSTIQSADMILVMVDGNIVEHGNHQELMAKQGIYHQMQMAQAVA